MGSFRRGEQIGQYLIEREVGVGNSASVYLASINGDPQRSFALKIRRRSQGRHEELLVARFSESARLQGLFCHPNIAWFHEYLEIDPYQVLALEYLSGGTLSDLLKSRRGHLNVSETCVVGAHLADGLAHMHDLNVIHRDLKPDNVLFAVIGDLSSVRIADFDVSKNPYTSPNLTEKGAHVGTLCYISPEQFNQEQPRATADVYSLGMICFEMLCGRLPFENTSAASIFNRFLDHQPLPPASQFNAEVSRGLDWVIEKAIESDVSLRIPSAATFASLLIACLVNCGWSYTRANSMRIQTHTQWFRDHLLCAPYEVQHELIPALQSIGFDI